VIALLQRVSKSKVVVEGATIAEIGPGLLVLVGVERDDTPGEADRLAARLIAYRVFADDAGRMNLSVRDVGGSLLFVPQFTLAADTSAGLRPSFSRAAPPDRGRALFERLVDAAERAGLPTACGRFGAHMSVSLTNDGPVTFWLQVRDVDTAR
jgi:D-aminoacyl-tRNA deacylase